MLVKLETYGTTHMKRLSVNINADTKFIQYVVEWRKPGHSERKNFPEGQWAEAVLFYDSLDIKPKEQKEN